MSTDIQYDKTPENSNSSSSLDDGIIRRGRRHGRAYPTSKRKILVCGNSQKAPELRMPSNEELKRREVARNAVREAMLDYQVKTLLGLGFKEDQKKRMETCNKLVSEMEQESWMF